MNQETNNFNIQGNNGIPNNQPLNNQNFNQGTSVNQQSVNPQLQPTPNNQQPANQMNIEQPRLQTMDTFDSGNTSNQSFNIKPPKKMKLGLIIGIIAAAVVVVGIITYNFISNNNTNNNPIKENKPNSNTQNDKEIEKIINENENIFNTSYVDSYNQLVIEYPTFHIKDESSTITVTSYVNLPIVSISTLIGKIYLTYPSELDYNNNYTTAKDFYNNYFLKVNSDYCKFSRYLTSSNSSCWDYSLKNNKNTGSYKINDLNWERYEMQFAHENSSKEYDIWITIKDNVPYMIVVDISKDAQNYIDDIDEISDNLKKTINDNKKSIIEYIINQVKFIENKEELFAYKEASVLACGIGSQSSTIFKFDHQRNDIKLSVPNCRTNLTGFNNNFDGTFTENKNNININDVYNSLKVLLSNSNDRVFKSEFYIESEEDSFKINNATMGDYEIKKYVLATDKSTYDRIYSIYVFKSDEIYGYIYNKKYDDDDSNFSSYRVLSNELDFAIKNLRLLDDKAPKRWQFKEIK